MFSGADRCFVLRHLKHRGENSEYALLGDAYAHDVTENESRVDRLAREGMVETELHILW